MTIKGNSDAKGSIIPVSAVVNRKLQRMLGKEQAKDRETLRLRRPYVDISAERGLEILLSLLSNNEDDIQVEVSGHADTGNLPPGSSPLLPRGTRLELGIIEAARRLIVRKSLEIPE